MELPAAFLRSLEGLPGCDPAALAAALDTPPSVSIRLNPYKIAEKPEGDQVPWCRYGFYLDERPSFTLDPAFHGGAYYVQEAGSMFVGHLLEEAFGGDCEGLRVLDLCASPGGKATLAATLVGLEGVVVANEAFRQRVAPLLENAARWGLGNLIVTHNDPAAFGALHHTFDAILVDAPCSGEGMMRREGQAREQWSEDNVRMCAARQRRILSDAWDALRPGGVLIYSTCTFNEQENERNVEWLMTEFDCEGIGAVELPASWGIVQGEVSCEGRTAQVFRFYPGRTRSEGFFAAALRKGDGKRRERLAAPGRSVPIAQPSKAETAALAPWVDQPEFMRFARIGENFYGYYASAYDFTMQLAPRLAVLFSGVPMGRLFHNDLRPEHPLALFAGLAAQDVPRAELPREQALVYLRRGTPDPSFFEEGTNLVCFEGLPLGWVKRIGTRVNNLYPKESAIRM